MEYKELKKLIEEQLYAAIEALDKDDLVTTRQQAARAASDTCYAFRELRGSFQADGIDIHEVVNE